MPFYLFVIISTVVFSAIIVFLVAAIALIKAKVIKPGDCKIFINDNTKPLIVPAGQSLLSTLSNNKIFVPSACGGGGTCALCKCQVLEGGGSILPTETGQISRKEQKDHYRLACQVKVRNDLKIHIPEAIFNIKKYDCTVRSNRNVATYIKELVLELPAGQTLQFKSGEYIQIDIPPYKINFKDFKIEKKYHPDWDKFKLWDLVAENKDLAFRAYSMANYPVESNIVMLNVRIATPPPNTTDTSIPPGIASSYIFNLKSGDKVTVSGPYGDFHIRDTQREMLYVGGGAGMAPMRSHLFHLFKTLKTGRKVGYWYGARSKREMFYDAEFQAIAKEFPNFSYNVALSSPLKEDNWTGLTGFIHQVVFESYIKNHEEPEEIEYYLCGPPVMVDAVQNMLLSQGVPMEMISFDKFG